MGLLPELGLLFSCMKGFETLFQICGSILLSFLCHIYIWCPDCRILHFHHSPLAQQVAEITFDVEETACGPSVTTPPRKKKNGER
ncbi:hypothetical protein NC652_023744 [Populus alba x Populus x berolinensis]|nr:hypothetical protein NC652_023744 [Populus alba x Populus x berolinensis]